MEPNTVVLITGASRGIGFGLTRHYLNLPHHTVIATTRSSTPSSTLTTIPTHPTSKFILVPNLDPASATSTRAALSTAPLPSHIDILLANAGYQSLAAVGPLSTVDPTALQDHFTINALGVLHVFQAVWPRMQREKVEPGDDAGRQPLPKFVLLGSPLGSIGGIEKRNVPMGAYGASKCAAHYIVRKIHAEEAEVVAFVVDPGFVASELGNEAARAFGMEKAPVSVEQSVAFITGQVANAKREAIGGRFVSIEGEDWDW